MERRPHVHHRPDGVVLTDEDICAEVAARLRQTQHIDARNVAVDVQGCLVTLSGHVCDAHTRYLVEELVEACPGVQDVENRILVQAP
jgi:osmotically-inducible protein OsmY